MSEIVIYESPSGEILVQLSQGTVFLTQKQMGEVFATTPENVLMHLKNIFSDGELEEKATTKDFLVVQQEGKRQVKRTLKHYNLDAIISVGYRVNSKRGVQFRQWATKLLNQHLTQGYTLNQQRFEQNAQELEAALRLIRKAAASPELLADTGRGLVEIVSRYTQTFLWLQRYDEGLLNESQGQPGGMLPSLQQANHALAQLKQTLMARGEATDLFAKPLGDGLGALLGNLDQTVFGEPAYPTVQSKAAVLIYFVVMYRMYGMQRAHGCAGAAKNHPFADGNKRSGAFLFVDFLHRNQHLLNAQGEPIINDTGLAALTLLVAESDPAQKETLIRLIMNMLSPEEKA